MLKTLKDNWPSDIEKKLDTLAVVERKLDACQDRMSSLAKILTMLEDKIEQLENRARKSNLITYVIVDTANKSSETLDSAVKEAY